MKCNHSYQGKIVRFKYYYYCCYYHHHTLHTTHSRPLTSTTNYFNAFSVIVVFA